MQTKEVLHERKQLPVRATVEDVPFFPQEKYYCGPAALAMVLAWSDVPVIQDDLVSQVYTPSRQGTLRSDVLAAARRHGRLAVQVGNLRDLLSEIAAGHPVVVFQNLAFGWFPQWHYAVAFAYDLEAREIVLRSGLNEQRVLDLSTFERTWERGEYWAVVVLPPERLPASAGEPAVLEAAVSLERVEKFSEASTAYAAIVERWPQSFPPRIGLGNSLYAVGDYIGAERAYREAVRRHPEAAAAWNNLAYALAAQGRRDEALRAARKAVRLRSEDEAYRDTLRELSSEES